MLVSRTCFVVMLSACFAVDAEIGIPYFKPSGKSLTRTVASCVVAPTSALAPHLEGDAVNLSVDSQKYVTRSPVHEAASIATRLTSASVSSKSRLGKTATQDLLSSRSPISKWKANLSTESGLRLQPRQMVQNMNGTCGVQTETIVQVENGTSTTQVTIVSPNCGGPAILNSFAHAATPMDTFIRSLTPSAVKVTGPNGASHLTPPVTGEPRVSLDGSEIESSALGSEKKSPENLENPGKLAPAATAIPFPAIKTILQPSTAEMSQPVGCPEPLSSLPSAPARSQLAHDQHPDQAASLINPAVLSNIMHAIALMDGPREHNAESSGIASVLVGSLNIGSPGSPQEHEGGSMIGIPLQTLSPSQISGEETPSESEMIRNYASSVNFISTMSLANSVSAMTHGAMITNLPNAAVAEDPADLLRSRSAIIAAEGDNLSADRPAEQISDVSLVSVEKVIITVGTQLYTAGLFSAPSTTFLTFESRTLAVEGTAMTISGKVISFVSNGMVVDGNREAGSTATTGGGEAMSYNPPSATGIGQENTNSPSADSGGAVSSERCWACWFMFYALASLLIAYS